MDRKQAKEYAKQGLEDYLHHKGIDTKKPFRCLNPEHNDSHPSMSYDRKRHKIHCFSCGKDYDIFDLIGIDFGLNDYADIFNKAYEYFNLDIEIEPSKLNKNTHINTYTQEKNVEEYYEKCNKELSLTGYSYIKSRGLSEEIANKYMLGIERYFNKGTGTTTWEALIIPTGPHTYTARNTDPNADKNNRVRKVGSSVLFNKRALKEAQKPIYVVEGEIDALSIIEVGGEAIALGSTANYKQLIAYLEKNKPVQPLIIALDNDISGQNTANKLEKELGRLHIAFYKFDPYNGKKDANEALQTNRQAFKQAIEEAEHIQEQVLEEEKQAYLSTSASFHLQDFINGITDSVNTPCISTGFKNLDKTLGGGLYEGLYICGAISSLGKTTLVLQIADQVAQAGEDVLVFSLEMARNELIAKSISRLTLLDVMINNGNIQNAKSTRGITCGNRYKNYNKEELTLIQDAINTYEKYAKHVYISEGVGNIGVREIRETVEKHMFFTGKKPVVIVDYLQILAPYNDRATDKQNIDKAVLELKRISRDYKLPLIAISSVNRASYNTPISMEALKESGSVEFGSDVIWGLQLRGVGSKDFDVNMAKSKNPREIELVVLKNRNGITGEKVNFQYYPIFNYFKEI